MALESFVSSRALCRRTLPLVLPAILAWPVPSSGAAEAIEFAEADIFYELDATAGDVGVHVSLDAESWRELRIESPAGHTIIEVEPKGNLKEIGLTELFFEGEEPSLDEVPFARFRSLFPEGNYLFVARTTDNQELRSTDPLTAELPCPVTVVSPGEEEAVSPDEVVVSWQPAPGVFNPDTKKCDTGEDVELVGYQVIVLLENEDNESAARVPRRPASRGDEGASPGGVRRGRRTLGGHGVPARGAGDRGQRQQDDHSAGLPSGVA